MSIFSFSSVAVVKTEIKEPPQHFRPRYLRTYVLYWLCEWFQRQTCWL